MKALLTAICILFVGTIFAQKDYANVYIHASVGMSNKTEFIYELETGFKGTESPLFISAVGMIFNAKTSNEQWSHGYLGLRANGLIYTSELTAISPLATLYQHWTGEGGKMKSVDYDAGLRFYRFSANPGMTSAAWTITARYIHSQELIFDKMAAPTFIPINRFIISVGIHGLF